MSILTTVWDDIKGFFTADVEPALKTFLTQFATQDGQLILTTAIGAVGALATGTPFSALAASLVTTLISKSETIAAQDAIVTLQQVQGALTIAKAATGTVAPSDTTAAATITASVTAS